MNILLISPFLPYPLDQGGKIRIFNVVKNLSRNHKITLACLCSGPEQDRGPLTELCDEIVIVQRESSFARDFARFLVGRESFNCAKFSSREFAKVLTALIGKKKFDLVQIEFSMLWQYASLFPAIPVVLDAHNIEYKNVREIGNGVRNGLKRSLYRLEEKRLQMVEETAWRECDLCFAVSEKEQKEIAAGAGDSARTVIAANGVDTERFTFQRRAPAGKKILFLGGMDYSPNLDAARYFLRDIFPIILRDEPSARLLLVGRELGRLREAALLPQVECHESVPEVLPWFYQADLIAVPLRQGAGTRIKVLEAMAAGLPVVATSKGCEGIPARAGEHLLVADNADDFARAVQRVLSEARLGETLATNARKLVETSYSWQSVVQKMEQTYKAFLT